MSDLENRFINRAIEQYDPQADLATRWGGWMVCSTEMSGEKFYVPEMLIFIDERRPTRSAWAHILAHLDLGHVNPCGGGAFTEQQERDADWLAQVRLDDEATRSNEIEGAA